MDEPERKQCHGCGEFRSSTEKIEITGEYFILCDDCCRKLRGVIRCGAL